MVSVRPALPAAAPARDPGVILHRTRRPAARPLVHPRPARPMLPSLTAFDDRTARNGDRALLTLLLVTLLTWAVGLADTPHPTLGAPLIDDRPGNRSAAAWQRLGERANLVADKRGVTLGRQAPGRSLARRAVTLPAGTERLLRVRALIETQVPPPAGRARARPLLTTRFLDADGDTIASRAIAEASALRGVHERELVVDVPDAARTLWLVFTNRDEGSRGVFRLVRARVDMVGRAVLRTTLNAVVVLCWVVLGALGALALYRRSGPTVSAVVGAMTVLVGVGVMLPESATGPLRALGEAVASRLPLFGELRLVELFKAGHFVVFFLLGLLTFRFRGRLGLSRMRVFALLVLLAFASEGAQLYLHNRTPRFTDLLVDGAGILLAAALIGNRQRRRLPS